MDPQGLFKVEDVNSIIKIFAFSIQDRFEEIDTSYKNPIDAQSKYMPHESIEDSEHLIRKYRNYMATDEKEIKYLEKLVVRIVQIMEFFKERSKNQQLLNILLKKIQEKLNKIVKSSPIDVQVLYSYIIDLAKTGFHSKKLNLRQASRERRYSMKKIEVVEPPKVNQLSMDKKKQTPLAQDNNEPRAISTANSYFRPKRAVSMSAKKMTRPSVPQVPKQSLQVQISKLYSILQVETSHIQKLIQCKDRPRLQKQASKQNASILCALQAYQKSYTNYSRKKQKESNANIDLTLKQVNNRASVRPMVNNWISRKRKMNQCARKRPIDVQNMSIA